MDEELYPETAALVELGGRQGSLYAPEHPCRCPVPEKPMPQVDLPKAQDSPLAGRLGQLPSVASSPYNAMFGTSIYTSAPLKHQLYE